jgi:Family of unknown function (DUF5367)
MFFVLGFLVWLIATIALRLLGQFLLDPMNLTLTIVMFVGLVLLVPIMSAIYIWQNVAIQDRSTVAMQIALPGMLLDVGSILFFPVVFPNIDPTANVLFAALMLWGYSLVLISGCLSIAGIKS